MPTVHNTLLSAGAPLEEVRIEIHLMRGSPRAPAFADADESGLTGPWYATTDEDGRWEAVLPANETISPTGTWYQAREPQPGYAQPLVTPFRVLPAPADQWLGDIEIADPEQLPPVRQILAGSAAWDPPLVAPGALVDTVLAVPGAALGDPAFAAFSLALPAGALLVAAVNAIDSVSVTLVNLTGAPLDLGAGTVRVGVWKR